MHFQKIGYKRVSTEDQNPDRQLEGLKLDKLFIEYASGVSLTRPKLQELLSYVREGDEVWVHSLDRLARNLMDLKSAVDTIIQKGGRIRFLKENLDFSTDKSAQSAMSMFLLHVMGAFAEFERSIIRERQREGIEIAKKNGKFRGRWPVFTQKQVDEIKNLVDLGFPILRVARRYRVSAHTIRNYLNGKSKVREEK